MLRSVLASRWLVTGVLLGVVAAAIGIAGYSATGGKGRITYCAQMRDGIGLYPGNLVTRLGVPIGTVRSIAPQGDHVTVRFDVDADRPLPAKVGAVASAKALIAVRELAVVVGEDPGPARAPGNCIPLSDTRTPLSLTESLESIADLAAQLTMGGGAKSFDDAKAMMAVANAELAGTGPVVNTILRQLAAGSTADMLPALGDLAEVIDNLSAMSVGLDANMDMLTDLVATIGPMITGTFQGSMLRIQRIMYGAVPLVQSLVLVIDRYGHHLWPIMDAVVPTVRLVAGGIRQVKDLLALVPPLLDSFHAMVDRGGIRLRYTPPRVQMPVADPPGVCRALNRMGGQTCKVVRGGRVDTDILRRVLQQTGGAK